ncbi:MAG: Plug domain-containing protein, partial [Pseudomonadota bacterium]|nr:Plug domain-containing protein [Pseudomonadota bacterium]
MKERLLAPASLKFKSPLFLAICCAGSLQSHNLHSAVLEEVVVTAQKKSQSIMDVGITMSILDEEAIKDSRIEKTTDVVQFTSNTSVKEQIPGLMPIVTIRGVGLNDYNAANSPTTGVYIDEVPLSSLAL